MSESVLVIGSIVVDLPMILPRHPLTGETLKVSSPGMNLGGKAVNQGLQSQLCGANVQLVGKIGRDSFGEWVLAELTHYGLRTDSISRSNSAATSCAVPIIEPGNQYILHVPGANADLTEQDVVQSVVRNTSRILLLQGEIPPSSSLAAARLIHQRGGIVICDPAPTTGMSPELLSEADILTP
ncbi:MAG: ribokinase, partial [Sulfobacillus thermosulfidooxidans]